MCEKSYLLSKISGRKTQIPLNLQKNSLEKIFKTLGNQPQKSSQDTKPLTANIITKTEINLISEPNNIHTEGIIRVRTTKIVEKKDNNEDQPTLKEELNVVLNDLVIN